MTRAATTFRALGTRLQALAFDDAVGRLLDAVGHHQRLRVHFATVHSIVEATSDARLATTFESADYVFPDGVPLVWLAKGQRVKAERVCGPDVVDALMDRGRQLDIRHFLYGGDLGVAETMAARLRERYPGVRIVGTMSPPFRPLTAEERQQVIVTINDSQADFVWIGLGSPKQEFAAEDFRADLAAAVVLPVGAAFNFASGQVRRAPRWMQRSGTEWVFRLVSEPRRLWRRYAVTNTRFVLLLLRDSVRRRKVGASR